jgi:glucoamylase
MCNQADYLWLEQQGEAFGSPGLEPRWTSSVKDAVGTAYSASSRVWFTCSHGILNEIYHPTIDRAQIRDMEFLVTDGETFFHEEKRDLVSKFEYIDAEALGVRYINSDPASLRDSSACQTRRPRRAAASPQGLRAARAAP